jgi:hypothetical protein
MKSARYLRLVPLILFLCSCATNSQPQEKWELLVPPPTTGPIYGFDNQAPIARWQRLRDRTYASAGECQSDKSTLLQAWYGQAQGYQNAGGGTFATQIDRLKAGQCIQTTDPRLQGS